MSFRFLVYNGVRQGSILSPHLFAVYLDGLLIDLSESGVGCYWGCSFAGVFGYADDIVLLASSLRKMLDICSSFAMSHKLEFNASKTQLICFTAPGVSPTLPSIFFNDVLLTYSEQIVHLGHILSKTLDDSADIMRATREMNRKANSLIYTFQSIDPFIKTFLLKSYCLSLYGCCIWSLCAPSLRVIEVALLRKIWHLLARSHTGIYIVHCVGKVQTISNLLYHRHLYLELSLHHLC